MIPAELQGPDYEVGAEKIPTLSVSASRDDTGKIHVTVCNLNPAAPAEVVCEMRGSKAQKLSGRVLTAPEMAAHNTFARPDAVKPAPFGGGAVTPNGFRATLPPKSVVVLEVE